MSRTRAARLVLVLGASAVSFSGCGPDDETEYRDEHRTITTAGDTCGEWQAEPPGSSVITRVHATCAEGMVCRYDVVVTPPGESGSSYGICREATAVECDIQAPTSPCPAGWHCVSGAGVPEPGRCFLECTSHDDCDDPFQFCEATICRMRDCHHGGVCNAPTECDRGICIR